VSKFGKKKQKTDVQDFFHRNIVSKNSGKSNVGYWVGMGLAFWIGSASADVIVVGGYCPSGYVAISCTSMNWSGYQSADGAGNAIVVANYSIAVPTPSTNPDHCTYGGAVCAKVCQ
jgi:hypothetical protein